MILKLLLVVLVGGFLIGTVYFRYSQIAPRHFAARPAAGEVGENTVLGGYRVAFPVLTDAQMQTLFDRIKATPRTSELETGLPDTRIFVTRSLGWGFPDVTHVILADGIVTIDGHLVYGQSDLGVNKARIERWFYGL